ncbi:MAG: chromosome segregation protein SMC [Oscillospiraceae bacterium]|nr:chromosome segregation protein SMC [Oscillospiraceae bacterium]
MYLKALEIQGFKSFPEKTRLTFEKQITAIVGPNGSGKSNISDAIRWVMGEQSTRTLRGGKMEDVIFGGTERRNQVGFAEVSLILDNSGRIFHLDQDEVMITRRYYRSGESEYAINRETVRLKDVHEILMDTGMGRDGYAVIDQGRIGEILSLKSVDRRDIFEEAAGISRFRHRKEEAERRLMRTEENLTRIRDKIAELSLQVEPLRHQAEVAKQYLLLRDQLRALEISLWLTQLDRLKEQAVQLETDYETAKTGFQTGQETLEQMYRESETFSEDMREKDTQAEEVRRRIGDLTAQTAEAESAVAVLEAQIKNNAETAERLAAELNEQAGRQDTIQSQIDERTARIAEIEKNLAQHAQEAETVLSQVSEANQSLGDQASALNVILRQESEGSIALAGERERLSARRSSRQAFCDRDVVCKKDYDETHGKLEEILAEHKACEEELKGARAERETLRNMIRGHEMKMGSRESKVGALRFEVNSLTIECGAVESRIALLSEMEREYQGFTKAVKQVMQEATRGRLKGLHGPVANLVSTDDPYALAIETALGGSSQNIIVDKPEDAKFAINYLKRQEAGRATFLPISAIRGSRLTEKSLESRDGFVGLALDLVRFDAKFAPIYQNLLGRTVIVETLDHAIQIAKAYDNRFKLVTLDGQVISAGGSMTGGSSARAAGFLSRANELKKLEVKRRNTAEKLEQSKAELDALELELKSATAQLDVSRGELRQVEDSVLKLEGTLHSHDMLIDSIQDTCQELEQEMADIQTKVAAHVAEIAHLKVSIAAGEQALIQYREQADAVTRGQTDLAAVREALNLQLGDLQAKRASLAAEREAALRSAEELKELSGSLSGDRAEKQRQVETLQSRSNQMGDQISEKETAIGGYRGQIDACNEELNRIGEEKLALEARRTNADRAMQEKNREILNMERECARLEQKRLAADMEEKQIIDRLWDNYELSHSAAQEVRQALESVPAASREAAKLKQEISALGTPNIGAIEQYEIVGARYAFLTEQRDDIEKAKGELEEIITGITGEMEEIFTTEFRRINLSFQETFTELFGGGKAALELEDETDILGCGIDIRVQPPGKSLKTITLLSGGEKSFVAIALYFSIQKIRPTPFCVMDEIEAALDEANVLRFAQYMRGLADKTQFISITHRRGTMEEADVLYGVTMQEQGVSRVIHVDLQEAEQAVSA